VLTIIKSLSPVLITGFEKEKKPSLVQLEQQKESPRSVIGPF
jgi:hypothetical protein